MLPLRDLYLVKLAPYPVPAADSYNWSQRYFLLRSAIDTNYMRGVNLTFNGISA